MVVTVQESSAQLSCFYSSSLIHNYSGSLPSLSHMASITHMVLTTLKLICRDLVIYIPVI